MPNSEDMGIDNNISYCDYIDNTISLCQVCFITLSGKFMHNSFMQA